MTDDTRPRLYQPGAPLYVGTLSLLRQPAPVCSAKHRPIPAQNSHVTKAAVGYMCTVTSRAIFAARYTIVQSAVLRLHAVRTSVCLSVCNVGGL